MNPRGKPGEMVRFFVSAWSGEDTQLTNQTLGRKFEAGGNIYLN